MVNPSPLRYPGGKFKISRLIAWMIRKSGREGGVYIEPFAGGAGVALDLLFTGVVCKIVINDYDKAIYSFWRALIEDGRNFLDRLMMTPVSLEEWEHQRKIYLESQKKYSLDLAFATFFLNRTNHSGVLMSSGPIGGRRQSNWRLDARYPKDVLAAKIEAIIARRSDIIVYNKDVMDLIKNIFPRYSDNGFSYLDPPYYHKGKVLYKNSFTPEDHARLAARVKKGLGMPWVVSYDDTPEVCRLYQGMFRRHFTLGYSLANNGRGSEIMFSPRKELLPTRKTVCGLRLEHQFIVL